MQNSNTTKSGPPGGATAAAKKKSTNSTFTGMLPDETLFHPPGWILFIGVVGVLGGLGANVWQVVTSYIAFHRMIINGHIYQSFNQAAKNAADLPITIVCAMIAFVFQLGILFLVFKVERKWKESRAQGGSTGDAARHTAIEIVQQVPLLIIWGLLSIVVDTIGDSTFISIYTDDTFVLFIYMAGLYAASTVMLARSIEYIWASFVAYEKWRAFKSALSSGHKPGQQGGS